MTDQSIEASKFKVSRQKLLGATFFVSVFALWTVAALYLLVTTPSRPLSQSWPGILIMAGTPGVMLVTSTYLLLQMRGVLEVDSVGVRIRSPLGVQQFSWTEALRYDVSGTEEAAIRVFTSSGTQVDINFEFYENAEVLRQAVLPRLSVDDGQEPLVSQIQARKAVSIVFLGFTGFFCLAGLAANPLGGMFWAIVGLFAAITLPVVAFAQTYRATLEGDLLSTASCFGSKQIRIDAETRVTLVKLSVKGKPIWQLKVEGANGKMITLSGKMSRFPAFRSRLQALTSTAFTL